MLSCAGADRLGQGNKKIKKIFINFNKKKIKR